jgi:N-acetylneuraminic acid mutarotase
VKISTDTEFVPLLRSGHAGQVYQKKYYLFGGKFNDQRAYSPIECFNTESLTWNSLPDTLAENKIEHTIDVVDKYLVVFGGYEGHRVYNDLKVFDLERNSWISIMQKGQAPSHRYAHSSIIYKQDLFIFGGMDKQKPLNDLWRFCFSESSWYQVKYIGLVSPLFRSTLVEVQNGFLILGGAKAYQQYTNSVYLYTHDKNTLIKIQTRSEVFTSRCLINVQSKSNSGF